MGCWAETRLGVNIVALESNEKYVNILCVCVYARARAALVIQHAVLSVAYPDLPYFST